MAKQELLRVGVPIEAAKLRAMIELLEPSHHAMIRHYNGLLIIEEPSPDGVFVAERDDEAGDGLDLQRGTRLDAARDDEAVAYRERAKREAK